MLTFRQRITQSANRAIDSAKTQELQVGNSIQIVLDDVVARDLEVSSLARMEKNYNDFTIHAGPVHVKRAVWWTSIVDDHVDDVEQLVQGNDVDLGRNRKNPRVEFVNVGTGIPNAYECRLLEVLARQPLVLVNPSLGTLYRIPTYNTIRICLTDRIKNRRSEVMQVMSKRKIQDWEFVDDIDCMAYLGTNGVQSVKPKQWCALVPNPYQKIFPYDNYGIKVTDHGVVMEYTRTNRSVVSLLRHTPMCYRYSPRQVDKKFFFCPSAKIEGGRYFLESSESWDLPAETDETEPIRFLQQYYPRDESGYSENDTTVFDVPGCDSYLSRYARIQEYAAIKGKRRVELFATNDKYSVSVASDEPKRSMISWVENYQRMTFVSVNNGYVRGLVSDPKVKILVYSPNFQHQGVFPEGGEVLVPFDPVRKVYQFEPVIPGKYFILPYKCRSSDFLYFILKELYGNFITPYRMVPEMNLDCLDKRTKVTQILYGMPITQRWDEGGMDDDSLARQLKMSSKAIFPLTRCLRHVYRYYVRDRGRVVAYYAHYDRLEERLWGSVSFYSLMSEWYIDPRVYVPDDYVDRIMDFFRAQGMAIIRVKEMEGGVELYGNIDEHARRKYLW